MDKLARRSGRLSITTLTIIKRIENPFPRWIDSFASHLILGWIEMWLVKASMVCWTADDTGFDTFSFLFLS